jgi:hypothetical protein
MQGLDKRAVVGRLRVFLRHVPNEELPVPDLLQLEHGLLLVMWVSVLRVWWRLN